MEMESLRSWIWFSYGGCITSLKGPGLLSCVIRKTDEMKSLLKTLCNVVENWLQSAQQTPPNHRYIKLP